MEYSQDNAGLLSNVKPGSRVRKALGRDNGEGMAQGLMSKQGLMSNLNVPNNPGPAIAGRTPLVGSLRRSRDMMVLRDRLQN